MSTEIKPIDEKHIAIVETMVTEQLVAKVTLEAQKQNYLTKIAEIDAMLLLFVEKE